MKQTPAATSPRQPARSWPRWMASSVEFGPGDQLGGTDQVEEPLVVDPRPAPDELLAHHRRVGGRAAERDEPEPEEDQ